MASQRERAEKFVSNLIENWPTSCVTDEKLKADWTILVADFAASALAARDAAIGELVKKVEQILNDTAQRDAISPLYLQELFEALERVKHGA